MPDLFEKAQCTICHIIPGIPGADDADFGPPPCPLQPLSMGFGGGTSIRGHTVDMREVRGALLINWVLASWMVISITPDHPLIKTKIPKDRARQGFAKNVTRLSITP